MASPALTAFNAAVDGLSISAANKQRLKDVGERLYAAAVKESARHLRKHVQAVRDSDTAKADFFDGVIQRVIDESDDLILATANAIEGV